MQFLGACGSASAHWGNLGMQNSSEFFCMEAYLSTWLHQSRNTYKYIPIWHHMGLDSMPVTRPKDEVADDPGMPDEIEAEPSKDHRELEEIHLAAIESPNKEAEQAGTVLTDLAIGSEQ